MRTANGSNECFMRPSRGLKCLVRPRASEPRSRGHGTWQAPLGGRNADLQMHCRSWSHVWFARNRHVCKASISPYLCYLMFFFQTFARVPETFWDWLIWGCCLGSKHILIHRWYFQTAGLLIQLNVASCPVNHIANVFHISDKNIVVHSTSIPHRIHVWYIW